MRSNSYDVDTNQVLWGTGNPVPWSDPYYRPGDNLYTNSLISWDPDTGKMNWYHQYTPGDMWDYDEEGSHILIDVAIGGHQPQLLGALQQDFVGDEAAQQLELDAAGLVYRGCQMDRARDERQAQ